MKRKVKREEPMNSIEELSQSLGNQLADAIQEVIKLKHKLRITTENYQDLQDAYLLVVKQATEGTFNPSDHEE
tara:strand:+ start:241 stop:459 length:219 start_codon:yes stop_codon:yes gene_type:complete